MILFNLLALLPLSPVIVGVGMLAFGIYNSRKGIADQKESAPPALEPEPLSESRLPATIENASTHDFLLEDIITLFEDKEIYLRQGLKLDDVARECMTNRTYVSNCINKHYGQSFTSLVNSCRVNYAKVLIANEGGNMKYSIIGRQSGFADEVSFIRNFKKFTGFTPSEWFTSGASKQYIS